ncbi:uncharacterized [Tachysurus ichikawai]
MRYVVIGASSSQVTTDSERRNVQGKIKTQTCPCTTPHWGLPLSPGCYRAPVLACDGLRGEKHMTDLWVMTNHRPNLVFLHVHPVGKSGRTGEQTHEAVHKLLLNGKLLTLFLCHACGSSVKYPQRVCLCLSVCGPSHKEVLYRQQEWPYMDATVNEVQVEWSGN